jgi:uncharacterized protein (DUF2147 family)
MSQDHFGMKMFYRSAIASIFLILSVSYAWSGELAGLWQEYDEHTGNVEALILIEKSNDATYEGKIEKIIPDRPERSAMICVNCPGSLKNQPLLGLRILSGMKRKDELNFEQGNILDPEEGKIYRCHIRLSEDGNSIEVTGYMYFNWMGQSEVWRRANQIGK